MSFPLKKLAKVILTVVEAAQAAKSLTGATSAMIGGSREDKHQDCSP